MQQILVEVASIIAKQYDENPNADTRIEAIPQDKKDQHYKDLVKNIQIKSDEEFARKLQIDEYYNAFKSKITDKEKDYSEKKLESVLTGTKTQIDFYNNKKPDITPPVASSLANKRGNNTIKGFTPK